jgi:DNA repair exonuclease SbcCD ATPase subunit
MATVDPLGPLAHDDADSAWAVDEPHERLGDAPNPPARKSSPRQREPAESAADVEILRHQLAIRQREMGMMSAALEEARVKAGRLEQDHRVSEALLRDSQSHQEQRRIELAMLHEKLADAEAELSVARQHQDELRRQLAQARERRDDAQRDQADGERNDRDVARWRAEAEALSRRLAEAEDRLSQQDQIGRASCRERV